MIGTLFSAKQLVRRIQNQLIKTLDKAVNRKLESSGTHDKRDNSLFHCAAQIRKFF